MASYQAKGISFKSSECKMCLRAASAEVDTVGAEGSGWLSTGDPICLDMRGPQRCDQVLRHLRMYCQRVSSVSMEEHRMRYAVLAQLCTRTIPNAFLELKQRHASFSEITKRQVSCQSICARATKIKEAS